MSKMLAKAAEALGIVKNVKAEIQKQIDALSSEVTALEKERDQIASAPRPKREIIAELEGMVDNIRGQFAERFADRILGDNRSGAWSRPGHRGPSAHPYFNFFTAPKRDPNNGVIFSADPYDASSVDAVCVVGLLGEAMKPSIAKLIGDMKWPGEEGLPRAEREAKLAQLNKRISELVAEINKMIDEAEEAGISLD